MDLNANRTDHADRIARTIRHIDAHLDGDLGLDALADVAALSRPASWNRINTGPISPVAPPTSPVPAATAARATGVGAAW